MILETNYHLDLQDLLDLSELLAQSSDSHITNKITRIFQRKFYKIPISGPNPFLACFWHLPFPKKKELLTSTFLRPLPLSCRQMSSTTYYQHPVPLKWGHTLKEIIQEHLQQEHILLETLLTIGLYGCHVVKMTSKTHFMA